MPSSYALGKHYEAFIKKLVESGRYASASEVVRAAMRGLELHHSFPVIEVDELRESLVQIRLKDDYADVETLMAEIDGIIAAYETRSAA